MIGTGTAIGLGLGLLGAGSSIWASKKASKTQRDAAMRAEMEMRRGQDMAYGAYQDAFGVQKGVLEDQKANYLDAVRRFGGTEQNFNQVRDYLTPYINTGSSANNLLGSFYGLNGNQALGADALSRFEASPDYQFALKGGVSALDNSAAAKGGLKSGNQMRAVTEYGQGLATQNLGNYLSRIAGISTQGLNATNMLGGFGAQLGNQSLQLGHLGANLGTGMAGVIGNTAGNFGSAMIGSSGKIGEAGMAGGTAEASGYLGMAKGFQSGLDALSLWGASGKSSFGGTPLGGWGKGLDYGLGLSGGGYGWGDNPRGIGSR